eukprot:1246522-Pyramimonas_sp.AAC.1
MKSGSSEKAVGCGVRGAAASTCRSSCSTLAPASAPASACAFWAANFAASASCSLCNSWKLAVRLPDSW